MATLQGQSDLTQYAEVTLWGEGTESPFTVTVNSLPYGFRDDMEKKLPSPEPPKTPVKDAHGNYVYLNKKKGLMKTIPNPEDATYKAAENLQTKRQTAYMIYNGTKDAGFEWDTKDESNPELFYEGIYNELTALGLGEGYLAKLQGAIMDVSGMTAEQIQNVTERFLAAKSGT